MTVRDRPERVRLLAGVLAVALVLVVACTRPPDSAQESAPGPESAAGSGWPPTLEDPYFPGSGNGGYQVDRYDLRLTYDPASKQLTGSADVTGTATERLPVFGLDLAGLTVDTVTVDGAEAGFDRRDDKLVITPAEPVPADADFEVTVDYHGVPEPVTHPQLGTNGFHHTADGGFAIGQPRSASTWFPVNDHPSDKAAYTFEITVPEGLAAISNGVPTGRSSAQGWTTWSWSEPMPMASYLTTLAIGDYRVHETEHRRRPMVVAVHADLPTDVDDQLARSGEVADQLEQWFGPYPFSSYGGIVLADERISFALETQSRPIYGPGFFTSGRDGTWVIVHEQAHQWFGNSVSLSRWSDIWLNEGFATYTEWLWEEAEGADTVAEAFDLQYDGPGAEPEFWQVPPGDPGAERMFHSAVYNRGAMAIHALRVEMGDETFFSLVRTWLDTHRHGNATADDFFAFCERFAGASLTSLFDDWLSGTQRPEHPGEPRP